MNAQAHPARAHGREAEQPAQQARAAGPHEPGDAQHLAPPQREAGLRVVRLQDDVARSPRPARKHLAHAPSDHQGDDLVPARVRGPAFAHVPAVSQHHEPVRDLLHLLQEVRDVDDGLALGGETAHQREQPPHVLPVQAAGGLVEHEHAAAHRERARDLHELLGRWSQPADHRARIDLVVLQTRERRFRPRAHPGPPDEPQPRRLQSQYDVVHHREVRRQRELLVDHREARAPRLQWVARAVGRAVQRHGALVRRQRTGEHAHERALARPVLAHERADLSRAHRQVDAGQGHGRPERLADAPHLEAGHRGHCFSHWDRSGSSSSFMAGSSMFSREATWTPVSMRRSTGWPRRCETMVFTPR